MFSIRSLAMSEDVVQVAVEGELDLATAPELEAVLEREAALGRRVVLDLSALEFLDSTGVRLLVHAVNAAKLDGRHLSVRGDITPAVRRVMYVTGVLGLLPVT